MNLLQYLIEMAKLNRCPICRELLPEMPLVVEHEGIDFLVCNGHHNVLAHSAIVKFTFEGS